MPSALPDIGQSLFDDEDCLLSVDLPLGALARCAALLCFPDAGHRPETCQGLPSILGWHTTGHPCPGTCTVTSVFCLHSTGATVWSLGRERGLF